MYNDNGHGFFVSMSQTRNGLYPRIIPFFLQNDQINCKKEKKNYKTPPANIIVILPSFQLFDIIIESTHLGII